MNQSGEQYDAVIIGSGFGGSIHALRLAEHGRTVLVLERGKRYRPADFPRDVRDIDRLLWRYPRRIRAQGLYDVRFFSGIGAVVASGVGGGSLIYANIHIRPDPVVFDDPRWPRSINRQVLDPYYDRVKQELGASPVPQEIKLPKRDAYRQAAKKIGHEVFDPDEAVSWKQVEGEGRQPCQMLTECEFGCPIGAKNTLDFTYLGRAEQLGVQVKTGSYVLSVEPVNRGYRVNYINTADSTKVAVTGKCVVLCAGTLGTNEILLRSRDEYRTLPALSRRLGYGYSGNGDFLGSIHNSSIDLEPWRGPDVTSVIRFFDSPPQFTMAAPTFSRPVMEVLTSLGQERGRWLGFLSPLLWRLMSIIVPLVLKMGLLSHPRKPPGPNAGDPAHMTNLFAIGRDNANGLVYLKNGRIDIKWNYADENSVLISKMLDAMRNVNQAYGGTFAPLITWEIFKRILTVHSLGGCHLSDSPETGVVSPRGEVHGYPRLFVADGSVVPSSIGFHPVMTISALAEYISEAVIAAAGG